MGLQHARLEKLRIPLMSTLSKPATSDARNLR